MVAQHYRQWCRHHLTQVDLFQARSQLPAKTHIVFPQLSIHHFHEREWEMLRSESHVFYAIFLHSLPFQLVWRKFDLCLMEFAYSHYRHAGKGFRFAQILFHFAVLVANIFVSETFGSARSCRSTQFSDFFFMPAATPPRHERVTDRARGYTRSRAVCILGPGPADKSVKSTTLPKSSRHRRQNTKQPWFNKSRTIRTLLFESAIFVVKWVRSIFSWHIHSFNLTYFESVFFERFPLLHVVKTQRKAAHNDAAFWGCYWTSN